MKKLYSSIINLVLAIAATAVFIITFNPLHEASENLIGKYEEISKMSQPGIEYTKPHSQIRDSQNFEPTAIFQPERFISPEVIPGNRSRFYISCILAIISISLWNSFAGSIVRLVDPNRS